MSRRFLLAVPLVALATLVLGLACVAAGLVEPRGRLAHRITRAWARLLLWLAGVRVSVTGGGRLPPGAAVFAANHTSTLDIPVVFGHLPVEFRILFKHSLLRLPVIGWVLRAAGHIAVDRGQAFRAGRSLERAASCLRRGTSVLAFPEGTRVRGEGLAPFKRGAFSLALETGVPVVPVALAGVRPLVPRGLVSLRPGTVGLHILAPLDTTSAVAGPEALAEEARARVAAGCAVSNA